MGKRSAIQRFEDLKVWQVARELVKGVYRAARTQPLKHDRGLAHQMTRAAVSITSNIAEGHEHGSRAQYVQCCFIAKGSAGELRSQVINAHDVGLLDEKAYTWLHAKCLDVSGLLAGYLKHLIEMMESIPGMKFTRAVDREMIGFSAGESELCSMDGDDVAPFEAAESTTKRKRGTNARVRTGNRTRN